MDSEHRHELAENDLARILTGFREKFGSMGGPLAAGLIALVAVLIGASVIRGRAAAQTQEAWQKLSSSQVAENFGQVADDYSGSEVAAWARYNEGRLFLQEGIRESFVDAEAANKALDSAKEALSAVIDDAGAPSEAREKALFALAVYQETVADGDTAAAVAAYQKLIDEFPQSLNRKYAESRIEVLQSEEGKQFYAWFSKQEPKREAPGSPLDTGALDSAIPPPPSLDGESAETPDTTDGADKPAGEDAKMTAPPLEAPAAGSAEKPAAPAVEEKPEAAAKPEAPKADPETAKPAEEAAAPAEKPAAETPSEPASAEPATEEKPATEEQPAE